MVRIICYLSKVNKITKTQNNLQYKVLIRIDSKQAEFMDLLSEKKAGFAI